MFICMYLNLWILLYTVLPPSAPTNVMGSVLTTSVTLIWSQSSMDVITDYIVSYTVEDVMLLQVVGELEGHLMLYLI